MVGLTREEFVLQVVKNAPLVAIDLVIRNREKQYLVGLRNNAPAQDAWFVPGGRIFPEWDIETALLKIIKKELGKEFSFSNEISHDFLGIFEHPYPGDNVANIPGIDTRYVVLAYELKLSIPVEDLPTRQHSEWRWLHIPELLLLDGLHPHARRYFEEPAVPREPGLYRALMSNYIHYDRQMWSRTKIMLAVQGAALVSGARFYDVKLGPLIMVGASLILGGIQVLVVRDRQNRDQNMRTMDRLASRLGQRPEEPSVMSS
jgi:colanic acid biosynthesis protein WcaH